MTEGPGSAFSLAVPIRTSFPLLLVVCLLAPLLVSRIVKPGRDLLYRTVPVAAGPFPAMEQQIFQEQGDIDILFLGDSLLWQAIDIPQVQQTLSQKLGRQATVFSFSSNWVGLDRHYFLLKDLLAHRKVGMVVFSMPHPTVGIEDKTHVEAHFWFRLGEDPEVFRGLPFGDKATLYATALFGAPRHFLGRIRTNPLDPAQTDPYLLRWVEDRLGFEGAPFAIEPRIDRMISGAMPLCAKGPHPGFRFTGPPLGRLQRHFAQLIAAQIHQHKVKGLILHVPVYSEHLGTTIDERECWPLVLSGQIMIAGVPPSQLFNGFTKEQIQHCYYNEHFNQNGKRLFTRTILQLLMDRYAEKTPRN